MIQLFSKSFQYEDQLLEFVNSKLNPEQIQSINTVPKYAVKEGFIIFYWNEYEL